MIADIKPHGGGVVLGQDRTLGGYLARISRIGRRYGRVTQAANEERAKNGPYNHAMDKFRRDLNHFSNMSDRCCF